mmetsp:Transcript_25138/g.51339  ORF Transcript_25138/g.51339 Transcript_25138/m.51339 type:complete len:523 (+) Transcript_25138:255-1823(+)
MNHPTTAYGTRWRQHLPVIASAAVVCSSLVLCDAFSPANLHSCRPACQRTGFRHANLFVVKQKDAHIQQLFPPKSSSAGMSQTISENEENILGLPRDSVASPLAFLLLSQFILFVGVGAVIPTIPLYGKEIGLSASANGIVISAPAVALLLIANRAGQFADVARKPAMIGGMALIAISDIGTAFAASLPALVVARLGLGAGRSISESGERGMLADLAGRVPELRGKILAAQQVTLALGIAIGAPLGGVIVEQYGPRASFLCVSAAAVVALLMYFFLTETIVGSDSNDVKGQRSDDNNDESAGDWKKLLQDNRWKGIALCQCGVSFGFAAKIATIPILAADTLPGGAIGAGALLSAAGLSGLIGAPLGGFLTDKRGARTTAIIAGCVSAIGLALIPLALSSLFSDVLGDGAIVEVNGIELSAAAASFSALVILWSIGAAAQGPALTAVAQELAPPGAEAKSLALPRASGDGTYIIAPFTLGLVADKYSSAAPGVECAAAGAMIALGALALTTLGGTPESKPTS